MEPAGSGGSSSVDSQAAFVLSNLAEVVERVLAFLPTKALLRVAGVSRLWKECVRRTLRAQQSVAWISTMEPGPPETHSLVQVLAKELEKVHSLPQTVLYMADEDTFVGEEDGHGHKKARKRNPQEIARAIERLFPKRCHVLGVITPGVIGERAHGVTPMGSGSNRPQEIEDGEAGFAILFPKIDGVKIETFHFLKDLRKCIHESKLIEAGLKNNPELRVVLIFGYNSWKIGAAGFLQKVVNILNEKSVMLAGGQVDRLTSLTAESNPPTNEACGVVGLSFSGPQIQSASVLLNQDVNDEKTAEAAMQRLKAANIPEYNTFGFMFACVGRGFQYYRTRRNVEADAFRKYFPNVPLFGFFGNGEIGCDRIVTGNFILRECNEVEDILLHSYTTVMILIHLGPTK